jgi:hypothetical protein
MREVTIKSVYGDVLYVAKGAADVRAAVEEAVRKGANLGYANLRSANLRSADLGYANLGYANLGYANLGYANLRSANLGYANLRSANLRYANLRYANLGYANLGFANLRSANLRYANLGFAKGLQPERSNELLLLREQVGKIRAYKLVTADLKSPIQSDNPITYEIGSTVQAEADTDEAQDCGAGINLATLPWCLNEHLEGHRILVCEFTAKDIAAIPNADGKFRVHKAKVVKELDLTEMFEREARDRAEFEKAWAGRKAAA